MNRGVAAAAATLAVLILSGAQSCSLNRPVGGGENSPGESSSGNPATLGPTVATQITSVTSPVAHGKKATLQATTTAGASCTITVTYTTGPSHASGLRMQTADSSGNVQWTWVVGARTRPGTFPIKVTCDPGGEATSQFTTT